MEEYYRHFKGNVYRVLHIAKHSETLEEMVVYQAMYGERGIWIRPKTMFEEVIERDGKTFRRFSPISAEEAEKIINASPLKKGPNCGSSSVGRASACQSDS